MSESLLIGKNSSYCCCNEYATEAMHDFQHIVDFRRGGAGYVDLLGRKRAKARSHPLSSKSLGIASSASLICLSALRRMSGKRVYPLATLFECHLAAVASSRPPSSDWTDRCCSGETAGEGQVDTGREKRADEATSITSHANMWAGIGTSDVGPVGCILDVGESSPSLRTSRRRVRQRQGRIRCDENSDHGGAVLALCLCVRCSASTVRIRCE